VRSMNPCCSIRSSPPGVFLSPNRRDQVRVRRALLQPISTRIPQLKSERGANLEQLVLASTRNFTSQIADSIFWNLRFAILDPEGQVFAAEGLFLAQDFPFYCGIRVQSRWKWNHKPTCAQRTPDLFRDSG
jgi:hypothetical protein